jgi:predicted DNA binding protein
MAERRTSGPTLMGPSNARRRPPRLVASKLRVELPDIWAYRLSTSYPEAVIEVLNRMDLDETRCVAEIRIYSPDASAIYGDLRIDPDMFEVQLLDSSTRTADVRMVYRTPFFLDLFRRFSLMWRFPVVIKDGVATYVVVGPDRNVGKLVEAGKEQSLFIVVEGIYPAKVRKGHLLTPRQTQLFREAMAAGYFEVPRHITLTKLAQKLGMAPSSLSEILAVVEKKLLLDLRTGPET